MRRKLVTAAAALILGISMSAPVYAGSFMAVDSQWKYVEDDGGYAAGKWVKDQGKWYHMDENGFMQTGWLKDGDKWYYLDGSGAMIHNTTRTIDGVSYVFDATGQWVPNPKGDEVGPGIGEKMDGPLPGVTLRGEWNGNTLVNRTLDYQLTVPDGFIHVDSLMAAYITDDSTYLDFSSAAPDLTVAVTVTSYDLSQLPGSVTAQEMAEVMEDAFVGDGSYEAAGGVETVNLGGYDYVRLPMLLQKSMRQDLYFRNVGQQIMMLELIYEPGHQQMADGIIASIQKPQ